MDLKSHSVAVIGAGPAGLYAAKQLSSLGVNVALLNRDIKPGGLAEYGIFYKKHKMKSGLRKQFRKILDHPNVHYFGNVKVGEQADISIDELREMGFSAILLTVGAQNKRTLGLPGEDLKGVYHAKEIVSHFNGLPPYSIQQYPMGESVAIVGVGNVMVDVANLAVHSAGVKEITAVARRSAADVKFSKKEFASIYPHMSNRYLNEEIDRIKDRMQAAGQSVDEACNFIHSAQPLAEETCCDATFRFRFLSQPMEILGDEDGNVRGLLLEDTRLEPAKDGRLKAIGLGSKTLLECDSVVLCIGNDHDPMLGVPLNKWQEYAAAPQPRFPISEISYESYDADTDEIIEDVFLAGWAREPNKGLVGNSRKDGDNGALAVVEYLKTLNSIESGNEPVDILMNELAGTEYVDFEGVLKIRETEQAIKKQENHEYFRFKTNEELLKAAGVTKQKNKKAGKRTPVSAD